jgi:hypothetical protein
LNKRSDFEGLLTKVNVHIQGILESKGTSKWKGTVRWRVLDDNRMEHVLKIPNMLLMEESLPFCILSPQHLSQEHCKSKMDTSGTRAIVGENKVELQWGNHLFKKTITISKRNNIPIMQSSPCFSKYKSFAAKINTEDKQIACFDVHIIPDDESIALVNNNKNNLSEAEEGNQNPSATTIATDEERLAEPNIIETFEEFEAGLPCQDYGQVESKLDNPTHELLCWHYKMGHESFQHSNGWPDWGYSQSDWQTVRHLSVRHAITGKHQEDPGEKKG